jgi:hypothetical protein
MGFDCVMTVIAECPIKSFLNHCLKLSITPNNPIKQNIIKKWSEDVDPETFFNAIYELEFESPYLNVTLRDDFCDDPLINKYINWIFFNILTRAFNDDSPKFHTYCKVFDDVENITITSDMIVKISIYGISSYKCGEKLNIDYNELGSQVEEIKEYYGPDIKIYTTLEII